jgi:hypothetical protein
MDMQKYDGTGIPAWFKLFVSNDYSHLWDTVQHTCKRIDKLYILALSGAIGLLSGMAILLLRAFGKL